MAMTAQPAPKQRPAAQPERRVTVPRANPLARLPRFFWWIAWPTGAGWMWLALAVFLIVPESLRAINLVTLIASFMLASWGVSLLFSHMRSGWCLWGLLLTLVALTLVLFLTPVPPIITIILAVAAVIGFLIWGRFRASMRRLRAHRHVGQLPVAGEPFVVNLTLANPPGAAQRGLRVIDHGKCHYHRWGIPILPATFEVTTKYEVLLPRRGRYPWGPLEISSAYPFGLFRKRTFLDTTDATLVLPRLGRLHQGKLRRLLLGPTRSIPPLRHQQNRRTLSPADFCGVREFRPGDSPRFIHWRTTARVGNPMVREFEEPPLEHLIVVLDPWLPDTIMQLLFRWQRIRDENRNVTQMLVGAGRDRGNQNRQPAQSNRVSEKETAVRHPLDLLEQAVSLAATLCWHWGEQQGTKLYLAVAEAPFTIMERLEAGTRGAVPLLERLATVVGGPDTDLDSLGKAFAAAELPNCPMVVVSTRSNSPIVPALSRALNRPVSLLDMSQPTVRDLFTTDANAEALL